MPDIKGVKIRCDSCAHTWVGKVEAKMKCPACGVTLKPGKIHPRTGVQFTVEE